MVQKPGRDSYLWFAALVLLLPLTLLLPLELTGRTGKFSLPFFLGGTLFEFLITILLLYLNRRGYLSGKSEMAFEYLNRTILGLPITIYLVIALPFPDPGILRFFSGVILLNLKRIRKPFYGHLALFLPGLLLISSLPDFPAPRTRDLVTASAVTFLALFWNLYLHIQGRRLQE